MIGGAGPGGAACALADGNIPIDPIEAPAPAMKPRRDSARLIRRVTD
jgi:hypothetical protein